MSDETKSPVRYAKVYDGLKDGRPNFEDRETLEDAERNAVLEYLNKGAVISRTSKRHPDLLEPSRGDVIREIFQSDGKWVWSDATIYYLDKYGAAPEPDFLAHIRDRNYTYVEPPKEEVFRAKNVLYNNEW